MVDIFKYKNFPKIILTTTILQSSIILAEPIQENFELSPIISVQEEQEKSEDANEDDAPPAPGLSFGAPSAYGASGGSVFVGVSYGSEVHEGIFTFYTKENEKVADGSMNAGFGIGDPNQLGAEISVGIISLACQKGSSCFAADGTAGIKLHKKFENKFVDGVALGYSDLVRWGQASDFATIYAVASKDFKLNDKEALFNLGIGTGSFRTKSDIDSNKNNPNLFGGIGIQLFPRLSVASSWNGSTLAAGFGISPFNFPLSVSTGFTDITDVNGEGIQYSLNLGYSFSF